MDEGGRSIHASQKLGLHGNWCRLQHHAIKEKILKKYLVVKMAEGWSHVVNWVVMPGLYTMEAAQQFVASAVADEPGAKYMIQEVGAA
jgi:hypothetical protein